MTTQSERLARLMVAASVIKDGKVSAQALDSLLTHGIAMIGGVACDVEIIKKLIELQTRAVLTDASARLEGLSLDIVSELIKELEETVGG